MANVTLLQNNEALPTTPGLNMFSSKYTGTVRISIGHHSKGGRWMSQVIELSPVQAQELMRALQQADRERLQACGYSV